jgi:membrane-associated protease RseP (regulator of RpoE activity)
MARRTLIAIAAVAAVLLICAGAAGALLLTGGGESNTASGDEAKGYLGLTVTASPTQGLRVASVEANGPAAAAGIQVGDYLRSVNGQVVRTPEQLRSAIESMKPGSQVDITYDRADQELRTRAKLTAAPANAVVEATPEPAAQLPGPRSPAPGTGGRGQLGVQIQNITPDLKKQYNLTKDSGIVITNVQPGSPAEAAGLKEGDIITSVNGRVVNSAEDVTRAIIGSGAGQQVMVKVLRGNGEMSFAVDAVAALFPGFENLPPAVQQRLRELAQSGRFTPEQLQRLAAGQNNLRVGIVKTIDANSLTIAPLETDSTVTYTLTSTTEYRFGSQALTNADIKAGNTVLVISLDGQSALGVLLYTR